MGNSYQRNIVCLFDDLLIYLIVEELLYSSFSVDIYTLLQMLNFPINEVISGLGSTRMNKLALKWLSVVSTEEHLQASKTKKLQCMSASAHDYSFRLRLRRPDVAIHYVFLFLFFYATLHFKLLTGRDGVSSNLIND